MKSSRILIFCLFIFIIIGCGYKPATYYTKKELDGKVFVNLIINLEDPRNVVIIKDSMNKILVHRLDVKIVDNPSIADTILTLNLDSVSMSLVQTDADGYSNVYKATVKISVIYEKDGVMKKFTVSGSDDINIESGATITDTNRFQGVKSAANKALEEVVSKLAINSFNN
ncbi:hypothetical protein ACMC56_03100 [Campylobacterota bacterium DY0563]